MNLGEPLPALWPVVHSRPSKKQINFRVPTRSDVGPPCLDRLIASVARPRLWPVIAAQRASAGSRLLFFPSQTALGKQSARICRIAHLGLGHISCFNEYQRGGGGDCAKAKHEGGQELPKSELHAR